MAHQSTYDAISMQYMLLGRWDAKKAIADQLRVSSGEAFAEGRDTEAQFLRALSIKIANDATELRAQYDREYPKETD